MRPVLEAEGWAVDDAEDGEAGLRRVAEAAARPHPARPDDAGHGGFEVAAELHRNAAWRSIPVVVMTAKDLTRGGPPAAQRVVARVLQKGSDGTRRSASTRSARSPRCRPVERTPATATVSRRLKRRRRWQRSCWSTTASRTATCSRAGSRARGTSSSSRRRAAGRRHGALRVARPDPDGPQPAGARRVERDPADQGVRRHAARSR